MEDPAAFPGQEGFTVTVKQKIQPCDFILYNSSDQVLTRFWSVEKQQMHRYYLQFIHFCRNSKLIQGALLDLVVEKQKKSIWIKTDIWERHKKEISEKIAIENQS